LRSIHQHLPFDAEGKRDEESYQMLVNLFEMIHIDNMRVLRTLIYPGDDLQPLVDGSTKKRGGSSKHITIISVA